MGAEVFQPSLARRASTTTYVNPSITDARTSRDHDAISLAMEPDTLQWREPTPSAIGILDLTANLLREIFGHFGEPDALDHERLPLRRELTWELRKTLSSLRLTCRGFHLLATPFMLTIVDVVPDQASLNRIDAISRSPFLARSVRGVCLGLSYYTNELNDKLSDFVEDRLEDLKLLAGVQEDEFTDLDGHKRPMFEIIREAWNEEVRSSELSLGGKNEGTEMSAGYRGGLHQVLREVLRQGFVKYQQGHEETRSLVQSGSFVRQLAASISRLPCFDSIHFCLRIGSGEVVYGRNAHAHRSMEGIAAVLSSPFTGARYQYSGGTTFEIGPAKVVLDLPPAIRAAGAILRHLTVDDMPLISDKVASQHPGSFILTSATRDDFKVAFHNLESAYLNRLRPPYHKCTLWGQIMAEYLGGVVSGPLVKSVALHGHSSYFGDVNENDGHVPLNTVLSSITSQHLRKFGASVASVHRRELEDFFTRFCGRQLSFSLRDADMPGGSWEKVFRFLHRKVKEESWDCDISLDMVTEKGSSMRREFRIRGGL